MKASKIKLSLNRRYKEKALLVAEQFYAAVGGQAEDCLRLLVERDYRKLVDLDMDFSISDIDNFRARYNAVSLLSKFPFEIEGLDRASVALEKFSLAEDICAQANLRLATFDHPGSSGSDHYDTISIARSKIRKLLGPFKWEHAEKHFGFGPGATTSLRRTRGDAFYKFGNKPDSTYQNAALAYTAIRRIPVWHEYLCQVYGDLREEATFEDFLSSIINFIEGNRVTTVPKNAKTERVIAIEPDLNMYIQKGIGGVIRNRLKRVGVNLDDQTRNQDLAYVASFTGDLATVDLSMASDSVSMELVELLLPPDWTAALKLCRSPFGYLPDGTKHLYRKVSSMGNGYTFELESLIFWGLLEGVAAVYGGSDRRIAVYGDDLVFPSEWLVPVWELLSYVGFTVNKEKSFWSGPFRESCGKHYFHGFDVTPLYIRKGVDSLPRLISVANGVKLLAARRYNDWGLDGTLKPVYDFVVGQIPRQLQRLLRGPAEFGDQVLWTEWDDVRPKSALHGWQGWQCHILIEKMLPKPVDGVPFLLRQLSALERKHMKEGDGGYGLANRSSQYRLKRTVSHSWSGFGPWFDT